MRNFQEHLTVNFYVSTRMLSTYISLVLLAPYLMPHDLIPNSIHNNNAVGRQTTNFFFIQSLSYANIITSLRQFRSFSLFLSCLSLVASLLIDVSNCRDIFHLSRSCCLLFATSSRSWMKLTKFILKIFQILLSFSVIFAISSLCSTFNIE